MRNYKILLNTIEVEKDKHFTDLYEVSFDMIDNDEDICKYSRPLFAENENAAIAKVFFELRDDNYDTYVIPSYKSK